ncbi:MAG: hypothetical protein ILNGONEN_01269 [Syntrophorhabdaceae bacterium]|nr:hypothetical protein [Syntrophorhabdaceae bacterium]
MELFDSLFLMPVIVTLDQYLMRVLALSVFYLGFAYLINLVVLQTPLYQGLRDIVDEDLRAKILGWMFALAVSLFILTLNIGYIYSNNNYEHPADLSAHWTVVVVIFLVWLLVRRNLSAIIKALSASSIKIMR